MYPHLEFCYMSYQIQGQTFKRFCMKRTEKNSILIQDIFSTFPFFFLWGLCVYEHTHRCRGLSFMSRINFNLSLPYWGSISQSNLELSCVDSLTPLSPPFFVGITGQLAYPPSSLCGFWGSGSCPHTCQLSTLTTEPYSQCSFC